MFLMQQQTFLSNLFYHNELLGRQKQGIIWGPVCFNCFRPPGATHSLHSSLAPSTPPISEAFLSSLCLVWSALSPGRRWNKYLTSLEEL